MPFTLRLVLELAHRLPAQSVGLGLHGLVYRRLAATDQVVASALHQERGQPQVPAAFSLRHRFGANGLVFCDLNLLDESRLEVFAQAFAVGTPFGEAGEALLGQIVDVHLSGVRYEDMLRFALCTPAPTWVEVDFQSCTTSKHENRVLREPLGEQLWNGLRARWMAHSPVPEFVLETRFDLEFASEPELYDAWIQVPKRTVRGWVGRAAYRVQGAPEDRRVAAVLAHFAEFAGVGQYVAFGAGNVQVRVS
jgi:CRISPR-associated endoribonuclease Cas6